MKNFVITGDSLSYNRYGYDDVQRMNAWDCHIGMQSWSFRLRNLFLTSAKGFKYADELLFKEETVSGIGEGFAPSDAIFGERVRTVIPSEGKIQFTAESDNGIMVLYFQKRPKNYCRFKISVDGVYQNEVNTYGDGTLYHGFELLTVELSCDNNKKRHEIVFYDFCYADDKPMVTLAGVSCEPKYADVTGQGSRTAKFINYHFEERVARFSPDVLVLIFGGNDILFYSPEEYYENLEKFFKRVKTEFENCKLITITIPPSGLYNGLANGIKYSTQQEWDENAEKYNNAMIELSAKYNAQTIITKELFKDIPTEKWRYDEVHFTNFGNDILFEKVKGLLF